MAGIFQALRSGHRSRSSRQVKVSASVAQMIPIAAVPMSAIPEICVLCAREKIIAVVVMRTAVRDTVNQLLTLAKTSSEGRKCQHVQGSCTRSTSSVKSSRNFRYGGHPAELLATSQVPNELFFALTQLVCNGCGHVTGSVAWRDATQELCCQILGQRKG